MQIDWLTVAAQIANFLVLVFLLRRFLYRPVVVAMARRERRIGDRLNEAAQREETARQRAADFERRLEELEARRGELVVQAREQADAQRRQLLDQARAEVSATEQRWREDLAREQREFLSEMRQELGRTAEQVARKALADLADTDLEDGIVKVFFTRLDRLDEEARATLTGKDGTLAVATSFALDKKRRSRVEAELHGRFGDHIRLHFTDDPGLICGIELRAEGRRVGWSIEDYLEAVQERISRKLAGAFEPAANSAHAA